MLRSRAFRHVAVAVSAVASVSCGDIATSTSPEAAGYTRFAPSRTIVSDFALLNEQYEVRAVAWSQPRQSDQSAVALIGTEGGKLSFPAADLTMVIPKGALTSPTYITVTAVAGQHVVYDMQPHGLQFLQPVTVVQELRNLAAYGSQALNDVRTAYVSERNSRIRPGGAVAPTELEAAVTYFYGATPVAETHVWTLNHFSRYILISGVWVLIG